MKFIGWMFLITVIGIAGMHLLDVPKSTDLFDFVRHATGFTLLTIVGAINATVIGKSNR